MDSLEKFYNTNFIILTEKDLMTTVYRRKHKNLSLDPIYMKPFIQGITVVHSTEVRRDSLYKIVLNTRFTHIFNDK